MVALKESNKEIRHQTLENILRQWWSQWYIRSGENFDQSTNDAHTAHCHYVMNYLEKNVLEQLKDFKKLHLLNREEREERLRLGAVIYGRDLLSEDGLELVLLAKPQ